MTGTNPLETFLEYGRMQKEFQALGHKIILKTLNGGQLLDVWESTGHLDELSRSYASCIETLARAIFAIDNEPVFYIPKDKDDASTPEKLIEQNKAIIKKWNTGVIDLFYSKYNDLLKEQNEKFVELKNALANSGSAPSGKSQNKLESTK